MEARCPCCGSEELVWDHFSGDVVCSRCGCVVSRIYVSHPVSLEEGQGRPAARRHPSLVTRLAFRVLRGRRPGLAIDNDAFKRYVADGGRRSIRVYVRIDTPPRLRELRSKYPCIRRAMEALDNYPRLASRTLRVRIALAYYVCMAAKGRVPSSSEVARITGTSLKHIEGLIRLLHRTHLIRELVERVMEGEERRYEEEHY